MHYFRPRVWQSRVLCLGVARGILKIGLFGRFCGYSCAMLGSTVDTRSASVLGAFGRVLHIFYREMDSDPKVFSLRSHAEWRIVLSRCFSSQSWYASSHLEIRKVFLRGSHVAGSCDDGADFLGHLCQTQVPGVPVQRGSQTPGCPAHIAN